MMKTWRDRVHELTHHGPDAGEGGGSVDDEHLPEVLGVVLLVDLRDLLQEASRGLVELLV